MGSRREKQLRGREAAGSRGAAGCGRHSPLSARPSCYADVPGRVCTLDEQAGTAGSVVSPVPGALSLPPTHLSQVRSELSVGSFLCRQEVGALVGRSDGTAAGGVMPGAVHVC